jgi:serine/threonine protein kinase
VICCSALDRLHKSGILHRDIKPENILINLESSKDGGNTEAGVKLIDFGCAFKFAEGGPAHVTFTPVIGTPAFLHPRLLGNLWVSEKSKHVYASSIASTTRTFNTLVPHEFHSAIHLLLSNRMRRLGNIPRNPISGLLVLCSVKCWLDHLKVIYPAMWTLQLAN